MKPGFLKTILLYCPCVLFCMHANAQSTGDSATDYALSVYHKAVAPETSLYNGRQYFDYTYTLKGQFPYFESPSPINGSITYNNILYNDVQLQYDIIAGVVVAITKTNNYQVILTNESISSFTLDGHYFVRLNANGKTIREGFYEVLYGGQSAVYKKEVKSIQEDVTISEGLKRTVVTSVTYYIQKGNEFFEIGRKGDILSVFKEKKKDLSQFIKKNDLDFKNDKEGAFKKIAAYYDTLTR